MFTLYIDADSCPKNLRVILLRCITKNGYRAFFVSDRPLKDVQLAKQEQTALLRKKAKQEGVTDALVLRSIQSEIESVVVDSGMDSADDWIVENAELPCLAITHDIPLAARLVERDIPVIDDRGGIYNKENMANRLSVRNVMTEFREMGIFSQKNKPMGPKEVKAFSDSLNSLLHILTVKQ
ncbi:hypothetical protein SpiGrapes_3255 [Sphaerochaeta pleomorpha str. Grapes]|uniref:UPF0178 protein SpiGrapes_3255 n=1 Tax=Sphaerochaeta pleomorpha (strain ATCC BAA-1885 / DSM 22778 / Grapes) TaxID=158190 RepID=G8QR64_SPHPG|nr:DUF188 domain-containing protein [Sphaerochaeta pleomorpha]AEV30999.1 hypothetical protein SpiGrapes_3255 [Sphaerochaeta pleomorpha str. Grapes]